MDKSIEELRGLIKKLREDISQAPVPKEAPSSKAQVVFHSPERAAAQAPSPPLKTASDLPPPGVSGGGVSPLLKTGSDLPPPAEPVSDLEPESLYTPEPPMLPTLKDRPAPEEFFTARVLFWRRFWSVACLIAAAVGAYGGHGVVLAGGLLGAAIGAAAGFWASSLAGVGEDEIEDLVHRVDVLERRLASLGRPSSPGGIPPGLEEDIRELRRILLAMIKSWEEAPQAGPPSEAEE